MARKSDFLREEREKLHIINEYFRAKEKERLLARCMQTLKFNVVMRKVQRFYAKKL
jgi:hypothetical protein